MNAVYIIIIACIPGGMLFFLFRFIWKCRPKKEELETHRNFRKRIFDIKDLRKNQRRYMADKYRRLKIERKDDE